MSEAGKKSFYKSKNCPTTEKLLIYATEKLSVQENCLTARHLEQCEFCAAETQLLARFPPLREKVTPVEIPLALRQFAELMLRKTLVQTL